MCWYRYRSSSAGTTKGIEDENDLNEETNETFGIKENDENDTCNYMFAIMFISRFL